MASFRDFAVPRTVVNPTRNFTSEFQNLCTGVYAVNHGEFEGAVDVLVEQAGIDEKIRFNFEVKQSDERAKVSLISPIT
jgi:hypothetical protein